MKEFLERITEETAAAFAALGYEKKHGAVTISNRPDLCEFQCNGAMALAKQEKKNPLEIAEAVAGKLRENKDTVFSEVSAVRPGFLNFRVKEAFLAEYLGEMAASDRFGAPLAPEKKKMIIDYGGPNVAKPLHVGHLRAAIIGESIKRICRFAGHEVIGDVHLGDWGLQMGLIITELHERKPSLPYFDPEFDGDYPEDAPFTIGELEEIYPTASARSKEDEAYKEAALLATKELQEGRRGYRALFKHILAVSVADLKKNYQDLNVEFDLWMGESDVQELIEPMARRLKEEGYAYESEGALVVDVAEEADTKEVPPCMILKSDGASLYTTTDLATLQWREDHEKPDHVVYVVDKRQEMHFTQVFRCARKTGIVRPETELTFIGFGTMNGKDGKPFKTREGGVMRLADLIADIREEMKKKILDSGRGATEGEAGETAKLVALSALKYGDLSNQAEKNYIFDVDRFTSFEGNTGPYILYTIVRIKSILRKYRETGGTLEGARILAASGEGEKELMMKAARFPEMIRSAAADLSPHRICAYLYELSDAFNHFYHENRILAEEDEEKKKSYLALLVLVRDLAEQCIELLGFSAPEEM
ncbi:MAG: arginine--tRNA ligase [Lachnospiraceae bacterium]|nr:arginine--tRNA ligase [Lachnospiraceae bacterium]